MAQRPLDVDDPAVVWPDDAIEVGRIAEAWGLQGGLRVQPFSADPQALFSSRQWFLRPPEGKPLAKGSPEAPALLRIASAREQGDAIVVTARNLTDRTDAEALRGWRVFVSRKSFPSTTDGEYYWIDLIGLNVVNRQGEPIGAVADLLDTGAHSVLRVMRIEPAPDGKTKEVERLIPFVAAYVDEVSLAERRITVDWGLDY